MSMQDEHRLAVRDCCRHHIYASENVSWSVRLDQQASLRPLIRRIHNHEQSR